MKTITKKDIEPFVDGEFVKDLEAARPAIERLRERVKPWWAKYALKVVLGIVDDVIEAER